MRENEHQKNVLAFYRFLFDNPSYTPDAMISDISKLAADPTVNTRRPNNFKTAFALVFTQKYQDKIKQNNPEASTKLSLLNQANSFYKVYNMESLKRKAEDSDARSDTDDDIVPVSSSSAAAGAAASKPSHRKKIPRRSQDTESALSQLRRHLTELESKISSQERKITNLQAKITPHETTKAELESKIESLKQNTEARITQLEQELESYKKTNVTTTKLAQIKDEIDKSIAALTIKFNQLELLPSSVESHKSYIKQLHKNCADHTVKLIALTENIATTTTSLDTAHKSIHAHNKAHLEAEIRLNEDLSTLRNTTEQALKKIGDTIQTTKIEINSLASTITQLKQTILNLTRELETQKSANAALVARVSELEQQQSATNTALATRLSELEQQQSAANAALASRVSELEQQQSAANTALATRLSELEQQQSAANAALASRVSELEQQQSAANTALASRVSELAGIVDRLDKQGKTDAPQIAKITELEIAATRMRVFLNTYNASMSQPSIPPRRPPPPPLPLPAAAFSMMTDAGDSDQNQVAFSEFDLLFPTGLPAPAASAPTRTSISSYAALALGAGLYRTTPPANPTAESNPNLDLFGNPF